MHSTAPQNKRPTVSFLLSVPQFSQQSLIRVMSCRLIIVFSIINNFTISTGTMLLPTITFWLLNGLLLVVDTTGKPSFITRYRIQVDKNNPVGCVRLTESDCTWTCRPCLFLFVSKDSIWKIGFRCCCRSFLTLTALTC